MKKRPARKRAFKHSEKITISPSSVNHPSHPERLRRMPKPKPTPVMRAITTPPPTAYPAGLRSKS